MMTNCSIAVSRKYPGYSTQAAIFSTIRLSVRDF